MGGGGGGSCILGLVGFMFRIRFRVSLGASFRVRFWLGPGTRLIIYSSTTCRLLNSIIRKTLILNSHLSLFFYQETEK